MHHNKRKGISSHDLVKFVHKSYIKRIQVLYTTCNSPKIKKTKKKDKSIVKSISERSLYLQYLTNTNIASTLTT